MPIIVITTNISMNVNPALATLCARLSRIGRKRRDDRGVMGARCRVVKGRDSRCRRGPLAALLAVGTERVQLKRFARIDVDKGVLPGVGRNFAGSGVPPGL